jgi:hypothetical protein
MIWWCLPHAHGHRNSCSSYLQLEEGEGAEGDADIEEEEDNKWRELEIYQWVLNTAGLLFSVPVGILPSTPEGSGNGMVVDSSTSS